MNAFKDEDKNSQQSFRNNKHLESLKKSFGSIIAFFKTDRGKLLLKILRILFLVGIISFLIWQLYQIGWSALWDAMPRQPAFYLLFIILYFTLPITEQYIYRLSLNFSFWEGFKIFTKKKVLNQEVLGYSGEAYFYVWAKENLKEPSKKILGVVKDNTLLSALASTLTAVVLLAIFASVINVNLFDGNLISQKAMLIGGSILLVILGLLFFFRKKILSVDKATAWKIFLIHELRIFWVYSLEILQWIIVLPAVPIYVWFTFLSVRIISSRIPFLPNRDLLFISASIEVAKYVDVSSAAIGGILLTINILNKVLNLFFFTLFSIKKQA